MGGTPEIVRQQFINTAKRVRASMLRARMKPAAVGVAGDLDPIEEEVEVGDPEEVLCERLHNTVSGAIQTFYAGDLDSLQTVVYALPRETPTALDAVVYILNTS